jgi:hypothetical protein
MVVTYSLTKKRSNSSLSQEEMLLDLLRNAENDANALAHSHDLGGHPDQAYRLIGVSECLREAALRMNVVVHGIEPRTSPQAFELRSRPLSLRKRLIGIAWISANAAALVSGRIGPRPLTKAFKKQS